MKSLLKNDVIDKLNVLIKDMFEANSIADNIAYNLESMGYHATSEFYHLNIAHKFGAWADLISDAMYYMGARPTRLGFEGNTNQYSQVSEIFNDNLAIFMRLTDEVARLIEELDFDYKNRYMVIQLEDLLTIIQPYIRVADTWVDKAIAYESHDNMYKFDKDFEKFIDMPK